MSRRVLFVDDEPNVLAGYQRQLRKVFDVDVALGGTAGLNAISNNGPYAVIVSDMRMPEISGIEFLSMAQTLAVHSVRMMLTGNADQQTAMDAVNEGQIFRFLTKPCSTEMLVRSIEAGIEQYRLITVEAELLEKTLLGSIGVLTEIIGVADPVAFNQAKRVRKYAQEIAPVLKYKDRWQLELAALLSPIGRMKLPTELLAKSRASAELSPAEMEQFALIPEISYKLLSKIPRLESVAQIVRFCQTTLQPIPGENISQVSGEELPLGARILKILSDLVDIELNNTSRTLAFRLMSTRRGWYDLPLLRMISAHFDPPIPFEVAKYRGNKTSRRPKSPINAKGSLIEQDEYLVIDFANLLVGDVLMSDILDSEGNMLLSSGNIMTGELMEKLQKYVSLKGVREPIHIAIIEENDPIIGEKLTE